MNIGKVLGATSLFLLMGAVGPAARAQDEKPAERPADRPAEKPADKPAERPAEHPRDTPDKPAEKPRDDAHPAAPAKQDAKQDQHAKVDASHAKGGAHRIPDDKFKAHFGQQHHFHVGHPQMVGGHYQFGYGGYNFYFTQPWPSGWGYDDDVYIVDIDGVYYLVNAAHPGAQLSLDVVL
jgi:hypothetical protein